MGEAATEVPLVRAWRGENLAEGTAAAGSEERTATEVEGTVEEETVAVARAAASEGGSAAAARAAAMAVNAVEAGL